MSTAPVRMLSTSLTARDKRVDMKSKEIASHMRKLHKDKNMDDTGEKGFNIDALAEAAQDWEAEDGKEGEFQRFPDDDVFDQTFNGVKFKDLPIVTVVCHKNNTRMWAHDAKFNKLHYVSPKLCGFKNAAKRTAVAAQVAGSEMGQAMRNLNMRNVRIRVDGFNMGRVACIKGMSIAGVQIVSISDITRVDWGWSFRAKKRPRK
jgi:ribosomal protein S11